MRAAMLAETRTSESPTEISPRQMSGSSSDRRQAPLAMRVGQGREAGLADEVRLGGPHRGHVELVAADDGEADAERAVGLGALDPEAIALVGELLVRGLDRLADADADAGRLVVVVLGADRLGGVAGCLGDPLARAAGRDQQVQRALGPRDRAHAGLHHDHAVGGVGQPVGLGHEAEFHLESDGHAGLSASGRRRTAPRHGQMSGRGEREAPG